MLLVDSAWDSEIFTTCQAWVHPSLWRQVGTRTGRDIFRHLHYFNMSSNIVLRKFHKISKGLNLLQPSWNRRFFSKWHFQFLIWQDKNLVEKLVHDFAVENWVLKFRAKKGLQILERLAGRTFWGAAGLLHSLTAQNRVIQISIPNSAQHVLIATCSNRFVACCQSPTCWWCDFQRLSLGHDVLCNLISSERLENSCWISGDRPPPTEDEEVRFELK